MNLINGLASPEICTSHATLTIVTGGSNNLSPGTFIHVISKAPGSPGEHGVTKSLTICVLSNGEGPVTV